MRFWVGVSAAFGAGTLIGTGLGILLVEDKLKKEYKEATASHWRAVQAAKIDAETPSLEEQDLIVVKPRGEGVSLEGGEIETESLPVVNEVVTKPQQTTNPYHVAVEQTLDNNIYASYAELSEEDYYDEDGRAKEQITMLYSDGEPMFFMNGAELDTSDAMDMVGSTIVDDMRKSVGEGNPILYMRNNQTGTDYEVTFEQP
jgi:hypothetical protein